MLDAKFLHECFTLDQVTGELTWKARPDHHFKDVSYAKRWRGRWEGKIAGTPQNAGYVCTKLTVGARKYSLLNHHIIWFMLGGTIPEGMEIDHINRDRTDNSVVNLRLVSRSENVKNTPARCNNKLGEKNIWKIGKKTSPYVVQISCDKKRVHIGSFKTLEEAIVARDAAQREAGGYL